MRRACTERGVGPGRRSSRVTGLSGCAGQDVHAAVGPVQVHVPEGRVLHPDPGSGQCRQDGVCLSRSSAGWSCCAFRLRGSCPESPPAALTAERCSVLRCSPRTSPRRGVWGGGWEGVRALPASVCASRQTFLEQSKTRFHKNYKGMSLSKITTTVGLNSKGSLRAAGVWGRALRVLRRLQASRRVGRAAWGLRPWAYGGGTAQGPWLPAAAEADGDLGRAASPVLFSPSWHRGRGKGSPHVLGLRGPGRAAVSVGQGKIGATWGPGQARPAGRLSRRPLPAASFPREASGSRSLVSAALSPTLFPGLPRGPVPGPSPESMDALGSF